MATTSEMPIDMPEAIAGENPIKVPPAKQIPSMRSGKPEDPFKVAEIAKLLYLSEKQAAILVSIGLSLSANCVAAIAAQPVKLLSQALWPVMGQHHPELAERPFLQGAWDLLRRDSISWTGSTVSLFVCSIIFYFVACTPWALLDMLDLRFSRRFKIQGAAMPSSDDMSKSLSYDVIVMAVISIPGLLVMWQREGPWPYYLPGPLCQTGCRGEQLFPIAAPSILEFLFHLGACLYIFDFCFGFWHMLHHRSSPLYRHVHAFHHTYYMPFAFVTNYATVSELLVVSLLSLVLPPSLGAHPLTQWVWVLVSIQLSIESHAGYDFPFLLSRWFLGGRLVGLCGPRSHDRHHQQPRSNFFPFLSWGDRWFRTEFSALDVKREARE